MRVIAALLVISACKAPPCKGPPADYLSTPPNNLSSYCIVENTAGVISAKNGAVIYDLNTPLFSDYAEKTRMVWLPKGTSATYSATDPFDLPVGAIVAKSFAFAPDLRTPTSGAYVVETRILLHTASGWQGYPYRWDSKQSDAVLEPQGEVVPLTFIAPNGTAEHANYLVPTEAQCKDCHDNANDGSIHLLGISARQLNRNDDYGTGPENELAHWAKIGWLTGAPDPTQAPMFPVWDDATTGSLNDRARAYLDANCAHCHNPTGRARTSGLYLPATETDATQFGVCKSPVAAGPSSGGFSYDITPGDPDHSIMIFRMSSTDPQSEMPEIGRSVAHAEGVALIHDWIAATGGVCGTR